MSRRCGEALFLGLMIFAVWPAQAEPLPRIVVKDGHFETAAGKPFVPLGVNWVIVSPGDVRTSKNISFHPDYYGPHREEIHETLQRIAAGGFNFVRIRVDADSAAYLDNVIDFVRFAASLGLYTEPTGQWLPLPYYGLVSKEGWPEPNRRDNSGINDLLLSAGLTHAYGRFITDMLKGFKQYELLSAIFCVDLWNELAFEADQLPFSRDSGSYTAEWGQVYDMADSASRQALADEGALRWIDGVIAEVHVVAPTTLITSSVFTPEDVYRAGYGGVRKSDAKWGDPRQPFRLTVIEHSDVDFLQLHLYPHKLPVSIEAGLASVEFGGLSRRKPILLGETGADKTEFQDPADAAQAVVSLARQACAHGFAGWAYWTWSADEQRDLWNLAEQGGLLAERLSPNIVDWCAAR